MLKRKNLHQVMMALIFTLTATLMFGQSFYKTYNQRTPAFPYDLIQNSTGYKIYSANNDFPSSARNYYQINTDGSGNLTANQAHNLGAFSNRAITYRTKSGSYIFMDKDEAAGRMRVRIVNTGGTLLRTATLTFPAGHEAEATAATEYSNGDVLVTYYHGATWTNSFAIPQRRIRWARVRPSTGAVISQGSILSRRVDRFQARVGVNAVAVSPNGSIFLANIEEVPISQRHYLTKINPDGTEAWFYETATLERGIFRLEATSDNQAIYNHTQSREGVFKVNGPNASDFTISINMEGVFQRALNRELILPTNDGGAFIIVDGNESGTSFLKPTTLHVARLNSNGGVVAQNVITQVGNTTHKRPTAAIINNAGELIVAGWESPALNFSDARPFLMRLGSNGQWVTGGGGGSGADLEMSASTTNPNPNVWQATNITFTLKNTGSQSATNVQVKVNIPSGMVLQGGNEFQASKGSFSPYGNQIWNVGTMAAGASETIKLNLYNTNTNAKSLFAQVQSAGGNDSDSTPGNGSCCTGLEDDEAFIEFNGGGVTPQFPDLTGSDVRLSRTSATLGQIVNYSFDLSNIGDKKVSGDYRITARLSRSNTNPFFGEAAGVVNTGNTGLGTTQDVPGAITVPTNLPVGTYYLWLLIDDQLRIQESNENNNRIVSAATINITSGGGGVTRPDFTLNNLVFDSRTTFNFGESVRFTYQGSNLGAAYNGGILTKLYLSTDNQLNTGDIVIGQKTASTSDIIQANIPSNRPAGQYYVIARIDDGNAIAESNENNNVLVGRRITIQSNTTGGGGAIDINMSATPSNPNQWAFFSTTITARNTGSSTASNVKVKLTTPSAITYRGGMEFTASKGTLDWWNTETWNIGSLNAGQTATLTVNFFRLSANGFTVSANVTSGGGTDSASVNFGSAATGVNNRSAVINNMQNEPFAIVNAYPNPSTEHITVAVYSNEAQTSDLEIISLTGKRVFGNSYDLQEGLNEIKIETAQFQSGQYFIKMNPFHPYLRKIDFTKVK